MTLLVNGDSLTVMTQDALIFQVSFDDADGEGIVFFGNYFRLAHRALEHWLPSVGIPWEEWFKNKDWGVPLRHVEADYLYPLKPGDQYRALIHVKEVGESSVHFNIEFQSLTGKPYARMSTSHVFVTRHGSMKKTPVPPSIRERLEACVRTT